MVNIAQLMNKLARQRPVFHSEADFQHSLAWHIHEAMPNCDVRLEYKPLPTKKMYIDLWLPGLGIALELKYRTRNLNIESNGELFTLLNQSAPDQGRYDFLKDIQRLEQLSKQPNTRSGFAILLTNDPAYWKPPARLDTFDAAFRLQEGRKLTGQMAWSERAGDGTTKKLEEPISLNGSYNVRWKNFADVGDGKYGLFRYLAVQL